VHTHTQPRERLLEQVRPRIQTVLDSTSNYHPIYGLEEVFGTPSRENLLRASCDHVLHHYRNSSLGQKQKIRIADVGCFFGFTTFTLAETFPRIIGFETNPEYVEICNALGEYHESSALFFAENIFEQDIKDHSIDCLLLFNMLHQVIFHYGLPFVKSVMAHLSTVTDVMFLQLATREEYQHHATENPLPADPAEVLAECKNVEITHTPGPRPFYKVERKRLKYYDLAVERVWMRGAFNPLVDKKNFFCENGFLKIFRHISGNEIQARQEYSGLHKIRRFEISPYPYEVWETDSYASVLMQRLQGVNLRTYAEKNDVDFALVQKMIYILRVLEENGLCQNDFSLENFLLEDSGRLFLLDYEHCGDLPAYDYFAFLLWNLSDWYKHTPESVHSNVFKDLELRGGATRVDPDFYPDTSGFEISSDLRALMDDALSANSWLEFTQKWGAAPGGDPTLEEPGQED